MTKLYRIEMFVLGLNDGCKSTEELSDLLENCKYVDFNHVSDIQETELGEWDDSHPLNQSGNRDLYKGYFPDKYGYPDSSINREYQRVRQIMLTTIRENNKLHCELYCLKEEVEQLKKFKEALKTFKDLI